MEFCGGILPPPKHEDGDESRSFRKSEKGSGRMLLPLDICMQPHPCKTLIETVWLPTKAFFLGLNSTDAFVCAHC